MFYFKLYLILTCYLSSENFNNIQFSLHDYRQTSLRSVFFSKTFKPQLTNWAVSVKISSQAQAMPTCLCIATEFFTAGKSLCQNIWWECGNWVQRGFWTWLNTISPKPRVIRLTAASLSPGNLSPAPTLSA